MAAMALSFALPFLLTLVASKGTLYDHTVKEQTPIASTQFPQVSGDTNLGIQYQPPNGSGRFNSTPHGCKTDWKLCFHSAGGCPTMFSDIQCYNETTHPSGRSPWPHEEGVGKCYPFDNRASVMVHTGECYINIYQDRECQKVLQGRDTMFESCEHFCWKALTNDTSRKNSKQRGDMWRFSGSWSVACPKYEIDCPPGPGPSFGEMGENCDLYP